MERYLKWEAICRRYERGKNSVLGAVMNRLSTEKKEAADRLKLRAYADAEYTLMLNEWSNAEEQCVKAQVEYDNLKTVFDATTSAVAYQREAIKRNIL